MRRLLLTLIAITIAAGGMLVNFHQPTAHSAACPVTTPTEDLPIEPNIASWSRIWYHSADHEIWADGGIRFADGIKVGWRKPTGATLTVTGRRLDGDAPPMIAEVPDGYADNFQASGLIFPTAGCWEIEARANDSVLTFVNFVYPKAYNFSTSGQACLAMEELVASSNLILVGEIEGEFTDPIGGFVWQTVRAADIWKGRDQLRPGERIDFLRFELEPSLENGQQYLLFMGAKTGYHLRVICPAAAIDEEQITLTEEWSVLQTGQNVADLETQVRALVD